MQHAVRNFYISLIVVGGLVVVLIVWLLGWQPTIPSSPYVVLRYYKGVCEATLLPDETSVQLKWSGGSRWGGVSERIQISYEPATGKAYVWESGSPPLESAQLRVQGSCG